MLKRFARACTLFALAVVVPVVAGAQTPAAQNPPAPAVRQPAVEKLSDSSYRIGRIRVDTARREVVLPGTVNARVTTLEYIANTQGGLKAYETALTLETDAITFNTALVLIGLDPTHARNAPRGHFDPAVPEGDAVEIVVECPNHECERMPAERLMFDRVTMDTASGGSWVYLGSRFLPDGRYLAQVDGVLVSFVHDSASIIEYTKGAGLGRYGTIVLNPNVGLAPGTAVTVTVRAVGQATAP